MRGKEPLRESRSWARTGGDLPRVSGATPRH